MLSLRVVMPIRSTPIAKSPHPMQKIKKLNLSNLKKCNQYWEEMPPNERGRLCVKCQHTIIDFRDKTDMEIAEIHLSTKGKVCGLYNPEQLTYKDKKATRVNRLRSVYIGLMGLLSTVNIEAQTEADTIEIVESETAVSQQDSIGKAINQGDKIVKDSFAIAGFVKGEDGGELIGASLTVNDTMMGTITDIHGWFFMKIPASFFNQEQVKLHCQYTGYMMKEIVLDRNNLKAESVNELNVILEEGDMLLTDFVIRAKRPWYQRIWNGMTKMFKRN